MDLPAHTSAQISQSFFSVAIISKVGNGKNTLLWTDKWLHEQSLDEPHLFNLSPIKQKGGVCMRP
jgi:hypothetical protein